MIRSEKLHWTRGGGWGCWWASPSRSPWEERKVTCRRGEQTRSHQEVDARWVTPTGPENKQGAQQQSPDFKEERDIFYSFKPMAGGSIASSSTYLFRYASFFLVWFTFGYLVYLFANLFQIWQSFLLFFYMLLPIHLVRQKFCFSWTVLKR